MSVNVRLVRQIAIAAVVGIASGLLFYAVTQRHASLFALDYTFHWRAARALLQGKNPYDVVRPTGPWPFSFGYYYPLPSALLAVPVAWLPAQAAGAISVGIGSFVFALAILVCSPTRWPLLLSASMVSAAVTGQFTAPLLAAAFFWPAVQSLGSLKPNLGLALFAASPSRWLFVGAVPVFALSLIMFPGWPRQWLAVLHADPAAHLVPLLVPGGVVLGLAALRWRAPEARLLLAMACVPQTMTWYDPLPVLLAARTTRESLILSLVTQLGFVLSLRHERTMAPDMPAVFAFNAKVALWTLYAPALLIVLRRPAQLPRTVDL